MESVFGVIRLLLLCGTALTLALMVLVSLPQSKLRDMLVQIVGWLFAAFCGVYLVSPIDVLPEAFLGPFGLVDDIGALVAGVLSARAAWKAG